MLPCDDPANDGQTCAYEGDIPGCARAICQLQTCTLVPVDAGFVCRASAGECDIQETCDGQSLECPADVLMDASTVCRKAGGVCDIAEKCDGLSVACPEDKKQAASFVCKESIGKCDTALTCDGKSNACPASTIKSACTCDIRTGTSVKESVKMKAIDHSGFMLRSRYWSLLEGYNNTLKSQLSRVSIDKLNYNRQMRKIEDFAKSYVGKNSTYTDKNTGKYVQYVMTDYKTWVGYKKGWFWDESDVDDKKYTPQGISVGEVDGFKFAIVGWHYTDDERTKIHIMDINDLSKPPKYRHVLLVNPTTPEKGYFTEVKNHAGGLAVVWPYLYEAHGSMGIRVFDLRNILKVSTGDDCKHAIGKVGDKFCAYNFGYILPQVGGYYQSDSYLKIDSSCRSKFSFISYDEGDGQHILSGEFVRETINDSLVETYNGRMVRWPLGDDGKFKTEKAIYSDGTSLGADDDSVVHADAAWYAGESALQGAISTKASGSLQFLLTTTKDTKDGKGTARGGLRRTNTSKLGPILTANDGKWCYRPEGIAIKGKQLWIATEGIENPRAVFYADLDTVLKQ